MCLRLQQQQQQHTYTQSSNTKTRSGTQEALDTRLGLETVQYHSRGQDMNPGGRLRWGMGEGICIGTNKKCGSTHHFCISVVESGEKSGQLQMLNHYVCTVQYICNKLKDVVIQTLSKGPLWSSQRSTWKRGAATRGYDQFKGQNRIHFHLPIAPLNYHTYIGTQRALY